MLFEIKSTFKFESLAVSYLVIKEMDQNSKMDQNPKMD